MTVNKIQIVAFNNPYPANFGGAIDMYHKIKALHQLGVKIYLHVFYDQRQDFSGLKNLTEEVFTYKQNRSLVNHFSIIPFSVKSRTNKRLVQRLKSINAPILFESLRTCAPLVENDFNQNVAVRCHNIEHHYSYGLSKSESRLAYKLAHFIESKKQEKFEYILSKADVLFSLSVFEQNYFSEKYNQKAKFIPVFHGFKEVKSRKGFGKYALYHGDLSIVDNLKSALFLIDVFSELNTPLIIASSTKSKKINSKIEKCSNIKFEQVFANPQLQELIKNAHINTLFSFQRSGTKLKVFNALFNGRHCIVNTNIADDESVLSCCEIAEDMESYKNKVLVLMKKEFKVTDNRRDVLSKYNTIENAKKIVAFLS